MTKNEIHYSLSNQTDIAFSVTVKTESSAIDGCQCDQIKLCDQPVQCTAVVLKNVLVLRMEMRKKLIAHAK